MSHLGFAINGIARSGTTALVRAINLDPRCFCSTEFFFRQWRIDYAKVELPKDYFNPEYVAGKQRNTDLSHAALQPKLDAGTATVFGNKMPRYFLIMEQMHRQLPELHSLYTYRSLAQIANSWDKRASNPDDSWGAGRTSLISALEWIISLARLADTEADVHIIDYTSMFYKDPSIYTAVIELISGRKPDPAVDARFEGTEFNSDDTRRSHNRRAVQPGPAPTSRIDDLVRKVGGPVLDAAISARPFAPASAHRPALRAFVDSAMTTVFDHVREVLASSASPAEASHTLRWGIMLVRLFDDSNSTAFAAIWPSVVALIEGIVPKLAGEDKELLHKFAQELAKRIGRDAAESAFKLIAADI